MSLNSVTTIAPTRTFSKLRSGLADMRILIAALLIFISGIAASKGHPTVEPQKAETTAQKEQPGTDKNPLTVKVLPLEDAHEQAEKAEHHRQEKANEDWWLTKSTIWLAAWTTILAIFTFCLWLATRNLVREDQDTAKRELRAYVALEKMSFEGAGSDTLVLGIKNFGQTPAQDVLLYFNYSVPRPQHGIGESMGPFKGRQMLHPGMGVNFSPASPESCEYFWYWGHITYRDIFNRWWRTNFCYSHSPVTDFTPDTFDPTGAHNNEYGPCETEELTGSYVPTEIAARVAHTLVGTAEPGS
jgi:hypothetical protein